MTQINSVLIVIVNYNGKHLLEKHLPSILQTDYKPFDIVVVDNASKDNSVPFLKEKYPDIKVIKNEENLGFGKANNIGIRKYPDYDYYVLVNNDISVEKDWLTKLVSTAKKDNGIGGVGPKILYSEQRKGSYIINSAGMDINKHYLAYDRHEGEEDSKKYSIVEEVEGLTGATLLIPSKVWKELKGFNEKMFMYYEDVDLCLRIRDLGYKLIYCGESVVYHDHMASSKNIGSKKCNRRSRKNRFISIGSRKGFLIALSEDIWYITTYLIWKIFFAGKMTLKQFIQRKDV